MASPAVDTAGAPITSELGGVELQEGDAGRLQVVFGALPPGVRKVDVLWPILGVVPDVPVGDRPVGPLAGYGSAPPRPAQGTPASAAVLPVTTRTTELGGAVRTDEQPRRTRVAVSADVLFALDSDRLAPDAGAALAAAAVQIQATGPGPVRVVGHTDDQGDAAYNEDLSVRRARTVAAALAASLPPDRFPLAVEGRGSASRRWRARRSRPGPPTGGSSWWSSASGPSPCPPRPPRGRRAPVAGPQAKGAEGLVLPVFQGSIRLRALRAVRTGPWLRVELAAQIEQSAQAKAALTVDLRADKSRAVNNATGLGLLDGDRVVFPGVAEDGTCTCPNLIFGIDLAGDDVRPLPVWVKAPDRLGNTVDVQLPESFGRLVAVPVVTGPSN